MTCCGCYRFKDHFPGGGCYHPDLGHSGPCWKTPRRTCPVCGRTETPLTNDGRRFKDHFPRGGGMWCLGPSEEEMNKMSHSYGDLSMDYYDRGALSRNREADAHERRAQALLDQAARELELAERARVLLERFGVLDNYPDDSVIMWKRNFNDNGIDYTYVALKIHNGWYLTGKHRAIMSHERLIGDHLQYAMNGEVWIVKLWDELT